MIAIFKMFARVKLLTFILYRFFPQLVMIRMTNILNEK